jgi:hypothetical protein
VRAEKEAGDDAQDIQDPAGPKTEVLEVLANLVIDDWRKRIRRGLESGLEGPSPFLEECQGVWMFRFRRACTREREEICFLSSPEGL